MEGVNDVGGYDNNSFRVCRVRAKVSGQYLVCNCMDLLEIVSQGSILQNKAWD